MGVGDTKGSKRISEKNEKKVQNFTELFVDIPNKNNIY
jgi:hypothetical protein